ncbi:bladder cancer associated transcript 1 isoform X1 [Agelaius tricolor]|uniref:bladder cancer associated transcript 1 isoform X1 n=1 Tax=Agelaius tricolor TaxID=9191 RepID=UPI0039F23E3B
MESQERIYAAARLRACGEREGGRERGLSPSPLHPPPPAPQPHTASPQSPAQLGRHLIQHRSGFCSFSSPPGRALPGASSRLRAPPEVALQDSPPAPPKKKKEFLESPRVKLRDERGRGKKSRKKKKKKRRKRKKKSLQLPVMPQFTFACFCGLHGFCKMKGKKEEAGGGQETAV